jgi:hypothetical protein
MLIVLILTRLGTSVSSDSDNVVFVHSQKNIYTQGSSLPEWTPPTKQREHLLTDMLTNRPLARYRWLLVFPVLAAVLGAVWLIYFYGRSFFFVFTSWSPFDGFLYFNFFYSYIMYRV